MSDNSSDIAFDVRFEGDDRPVKVHLSVDWINPGYVYLTAAEPDGKNEAIAIPDGMARAIANFILRETKP